MTPIFLIHLYIYILYTQKNQYSYSYTYLLYSSTFIYRIKYPLEDVANSVKEKSVLEKNITFDDVSYRW